jgi:arsenate reductase (thioredoxin)
VATAHMMTKGERMALHSAACDLHAQFRGIFGPGTIEAMLLTSYAQIAAWATVHRWLTLAAERSARERLRLLAETRIPAVGSTPCVLFLGTRGADSTQMACGWFTHLAAGRGIAWPAETDPGATRVRPSTIAVMAEAGIELTPEIPDVWVDELVLAADVVITMGPDGACPLLPGRHYEDWDVPDLAGHAPHDIRAVRDEIRQRVTDLLHRLAGSTPGRGDDASTSGQFETPSDHLGGNVA